MLNRIKNSLLCKCLLIVMTGYFSISSMNISNTLLQNHDVADVHSLKGMACHLLKKVFKCDASVEELEDFKTKDCKTVKVSKGIPLLDYLIPSDAYLPKLCLQLETASRNYMANKMFSFGFHGKIVVPPPRMTA